VGSRTWVDVPGLSTRVLTGSDSALAITVSAEVGTYTNAVLYVRALVDGRPASPGQVALAYGVFMEPRAFSFVQENVPAGAHTVSIQCQVDVDLAAFGRVV